MIIPIGSSLAQRTDDSATAAAAAETNSSSPRGEIVGEKRHHPIFVAENSLRRPPSFPPPPGNPPPPPRFSTLNSGAPNTHHHKHQNNNNNHQSHPFYASSISSHISSSYVPPSTIPPLPCMMSRQDCEKLSRTFLNVVYRCLSGCLPNPSLFSPSSSPVLASPAVLHPSPSSPPLKLAEELKILREMKENPSSLCLSQLQSFYAQDASKKECWMPPLLPWEEEDEVKGGGNVHNYLMPREILRRVFGRQSVRIVGEMEDVKKQISQSWLLGWTLDVEKLAAYPIHPFILISVHGYAYPPDILKIHFPELRQYCASFSQTFIIRPIIPLADVYCDIFQLLDFSRLPELRNDQNVANVSSIGLFEPRASSSSSCDIPFEMSTPVSSANEGSSNSLDLSSSTMAASQTLFSTCPARLSSMSQNHIVTDPSTTTTITNLSATSTQSVFSVAAPTASPPSSGFVFDPAAFPAVGITPSYSPLTSIDSSKALRNVSTGTGDIVASNADTLETTALSSVSSSVVSGEESRCGTDVGEALGEDCKPTVNSKGYGKERVSMKTLETSSEVLWAPAKSDCVSVSWIPEAFVPLRKIDKISMAIRFKSVLSSALRVKGIVRVFLTPRASCVTLGFDTQIGQSYAMDFYERYCGTEGSARWLKDMMRVDPQCVSCPASVTVSYGDCSNVVQLSDVRDTTTGETLYVEDEESEENLTDSQENNQTVGDRFNDSRRSCGISETSDKESVSDGLLIEDGPSSQNYGKKSLSNEASLGSGVEDDKNSAGHFSYERSQDDDAKSYSLKRAAVYVSWIPRGIRSRIETFKYDVTNKLDVKGIQEITLLANMVSLRLDFYSKAAARVFLDYYGSGEGDDRWLVDMQSLYGTIDPPKWIVVDWYNEERQKSDSKRNRNDDHSDAKAKTYRPSKTYGNSEKDIWHHGSQQTTNWGIVEMGDESQMVFVSWVPSKCRISFGQSKQECEQRLLMNDGGIFHNLKKTLLYAGKSHCRLKFNSAEDAFQFLHTFGGDERRNDIKPSGWRQCMMWMTGEATPENEKIHIMSCKDEIRRR